MVVKNISSQARLFQLGQTAIQLAAGASGTVNDDTSTVVQALQWQSEGLLQVLSGPATAAYDAPVSVPGYRLINLASVANANTVELSGESVDGVAFEVIFEFRSSGDPTAGNVAVDLGANTAAAGDNLLAAINANATLSALDIKATASISKATTAATVTVECKDATKMAPTDLDIVSTGGTISAGTAILPVAKESQRISFVSIAAKAGENFVVTGLATVHYAVVQITTSAGVIRSYLSTVLYDGGTVFLDDDVTSLDAGDIINIVAYGA